MQCVVKFVLKFTGEVYDRESGAVLKHCADFIVAWACTSTYTKEILIIYYTYISMLWDVLDLFYCYVSPRNTEKNIIFRQINSPWHTTKKFLQYFEKHSIVLMEKPAQCSNLHSIKRLYQTLGKASKIIATNNKKISCQKT